MTGFEIRRERFDASQVRSWIGEDGRHDDWPVVYAISGSNDVYVGESVNAGTRMLQHLGSPKAALLDEFRVVLDDTFNKSVCLDLETYLIRALNADGSFTVLNKQSSARNSNYYDRSHYRERFASIFEALRAEGLFHHDLEEIENSNLFKLSPFVSLTPTQAAAVESIVALVREAPRGRADPVVVQGDPGTGKTVVGIFLAKLLADLGRPVDTHLDTDTFVEDELDGGETLGNLRIGFVVPQQSLRETIRGVFKATPALSDVPVLTPFDVADDEDDFDVLIVDEAHRLQQFSGTLQMLSSRYRHINRRLFPGDVEGTAHTQLDWITARSRVPVLLLDDEQTIRPMSDLPASTVRELVEGSQRDGRYLRLWTQMRTLAGEAYIDHVAAVLRGDDVERLEFPDYDLRLYDDVRHMREDIMARDAEHGLSRVLAGFAWPWVSKKDKDTPDIEIDGLRLFWNRTDKDWINSPTALEEVGCIHTSQGYDLNYAGVIIGDELRWDADGEKPVFVRSSYHDRNGQKNNKALGQTYTDADLLDYVVNIYRVLLTRGIRGTYVYVCDPALRERLRTYFPPPPHRP
jgi:DUF2075 family protein